MRGGFDLYGRYYPNADDAMNAEMAQCNEIDNRINQKKIADLENKLHLIQKRLNEYENDNYATNCGDNIFKNS